MCRIVRAAFESLMVNKRPSTWEDLSWPAVLRSIGAATAARPPAIASAGGSPKPARFCARRQILVPSGAARTPGARRARECAVDYDENAPAVNAQAVNAPA